MYCLTVKVAPRTKLERTHFSMIATSLRRSLDLQASVIAFWRFRCHRRSHLVNFLITYQRAEVARKSPFNYFLHYLHHPDKNFLICLLYEFTWCYFLKLATTAGHQSTSWRLLRDHAPGKLIRVLITTHFWKGVAQAVMVNVQAWVSMLILLKREEASTWKQPRRILFVVRCTQLITTHSCRHVFNAPFLFFYVLWTLYVLVQCWNEWARKGRKTLLIRNVRLQALWPIQTSQTLWILPLPCDSILFLSEIRSSANRLIADSVLASNNWNRYKWCFALSPRWWKAFSVHRLTLENVYTDYK